MNKEVCYRNLLHVFLECASQYSSANALLTKNKATKKYHSITWNQWRHAVEDTALGLYHLGVRRGDRVGLLSENRQEWTFTDLGILSLGAINVPIYPTTSTEGVLYVLENAGIEVLILSCQEQYERLAAALDQCQQLKHVIVFDRFSSPKSVLFFDEILSAGQRTSLNNERLYMQLVSRVHSQDTATIIYTSGTTGKPKGVMLSHENFIANCQGASEFIRVTHQDISLSFLPLSHIFERLAGYYFMAFHGACIAYAESMLTVLEDMNIVKPTIAASVPRLYEKVYAGIFEQVAKAPKCRKKIFKWAIQIGANFCREELEGTGAKFGTKLQYILAKILVFKKIRNALGGRIKFFISGGAPLSPELGKFFYAADILILEGYGLTETSPVIAVNTPEFLKFGTVGKVLSNVEVKIAADGEILTRGPCVMKGYYQNETATAGVIDAEKWFYTGDIGELDRDGFLKITDRKKDIIVTSGGKNIAPQMIENKILSDALFSQVVVIGDKRNYLVALIVPNKEETMRIAAEQGLEGLSWEQVLEHSLIEKCVGARLELKTAELARYEKIKYFSLLPKEFTQEAGELTPTLKIKRKVVMEKYSSEINELYKKGADFIKSKNQ